MSEVKWRSNERLAARGYKDVEECKTFRTGYSDGFHGYAQWASNDRDYFPNAYSAGYWEGRADAA